jgi:diacylglycerol kinase family enzyme
VEARSRRVTTHNKLAMHLSLGNASISGFSWARRILGAKITDARMGASLAQWRLHDFRRSGVTQLAGMGFDTKVVDKLLAHKPARLKGVAAIYQRLQRAQS